MCSSFKYPAATMTLEILQGVGSQIYVEYKAKLSFQKGEYPS